MAGETKGVTRRRALAAGVAGVVGLVARSGTAKNGGRSMSRRMPVAFIPHAGGPVGHVEMGGSKAEVAGFVGYWQKLPALCPVRPRAVLVVSAHWEAAVPTVMSSPRPPMLYDYGGFPKAAYEITWPAPGDPGLAARVRALLAAAGFPTAEDGERGYDHGTFTPLKHSFPEADVPVVQLSLTAGLDAAAHLRMGRALAPLRDEGVFLVGSGDTYHNLRSFGPTAYEPSLKFNAWLDEAVTGSVAERGRKLESWGSAPHARLCHPREEHLIPLMVIAGAALDERGAVTWTGTFFGTQQTGYHFG